MSFSQGKGNIFPEAPRHLKAREFEVTNVEFLHMRAWEFVIVCIFQKENTFLQFVRPGRMQNIILKQMPEFLNVQSLGIRFMSS